MRGGRCEVCEDNDGDNGDWSYVKITMMATVNGVLSMFVCEDGNYGEDNEYGNGEMVVLLPRTYACASARRLAF